MSKETMKRTKFSKQNGKCTLSGKQLGTETTLMDTHRPHPKRKGGTYTDENTTVVNPIAHQKEHGTLRLRTNKNAELKMQIDAREQIMKLRNKVGNQLLAYKRHVDQLDPDTITVLESYLVENNKLIHQKTALIEKTLKSMIADDPLIAAALSVRAIGPITVAYCIAYIDLEKADHASNLWSYAGLHKASHERYEKGTAGGGNKRLRCILFNMAESQIKLKGPYRLVYDQVKTRLEKSEKIVKSRNTQGKMIECAWKDTKPCHRHGAALRAVMKHFLADYWMVGRKLSDLPTSPLYPEAMLGGTHKTIQPEERGWKY